MKKIIIMTAIIFCVCFSQAKNIISLNVGSAVPTNWNYGNAFYAGFSQGYEISKNFNIGFDLSYNFNHRKYINSQKREIKILNLIPYLEYNFYIEKIIFYVYSGFGISLVNMDDDTTVPDMDDMTKRYFTAICGIGFMYEWAKNIYAGVDLRYQHIFHSGMLINNFIPTIKISYIF